MKYLVQIKYTNPSHEHVSLRRRVDTVNRIVEAATEEEAINRSARQQRALGYLIQEAKIIDSDAKKEKEQLDEAKKPDASLVMRDELKNKMITDKDKQTLGKVANLMASQKKKGVKEEVEQIDEGATRWEYSGTVNGKDYTITVPRGADLSDHLGHKKIQRENPHLEPHEVKAVADTSGEDEEHVEVEHEGKKYTHHVTNNQEPRMVYSEEVELDEAQKKLKPSYWKAEWRLGTQSEVDKNNKKIFDKLAKTDPVKASAFHDNLMRMKKKDVKEEVEQVDEANMRFDPEAAARPKSSDVKNFLNRDKNARAAAASKKYIRRMTKLGGLGPNQTKKDTEAHMKAHFEEVEISEASKEGKDVMRNMRASLKSMDLRHGVDADKREAGYKMSPAVKAAQAKSDALSKVVKRPQAGTLAAAKMKTEAMDPNESKGEKKIVKTSKKAAKAAEKMVSAAKGKMNKINIQPMMDLDVKSK